MAASEGILMLSDKLRNLNSNQLKLLSMLFPLDLMDSITPGYLDLGKRGNTHIYALINWSDASDPMTVKTERGYVFEFWNQEYLGITEEYFTVEVGAHCAKVLYITDIADASIGCRRK